MFSPDDSAPSVTRTRSLPSGDSLSVSSERSCSPWDLFKICGLIYDPSEPVEHLRSETISSSPESIKCSMFSYIGSVFTSNGLAD